MPLVLRTNNLTLNIAVNKRGYNCIHQCVMCESNLDLAVLDTKVFIWTKLLLTHSCKDYVKLTRCLMRCGVLWFETRMCVIKSRWSIQHLTSFYLMKKIKLEFIAHPLYNFIVRW